MFIHLFANAPILTKDTKDQYRTTLIYQQMVKVYLTDTIETPQLYDISKTYSL